MKKNYQKPTIESVRLKNVLLLAGSPGSPCNQDSIDICIEEDPACSDDIL